jgi:hypothetical protein
MDCLALLFDCRGLVDEGYMEGSGSEHEIYRTYNLDSTSTPSRNSQTTCYYEGDALVNSCLVYLSICKRVGARYIVTRNPWVLLDFFRKILPPRSFSSSIIELVSDGNGGIRRRAPR